MPLRCQCNAHTICHSMKEDAEPMGTLRNAYRAVVPEPVRAVVARVRANVFGHNAIYSEDYYASEVEGPAVRSSGIVSDSIVTDYHPVSVIDVGCGTGALLAALRERGCKVFGLEYADAGLRYCRSRNLDVAKFDLENETFDPGRRFDVAISMEVAEHLPESVADPYLDLLTGAADVIVFTAAPPGQGGADHVNEQPPEYWIEKYRRRGFSLDEPRTLRWRQAWEASGDVESWYYRNLMLFRRTPM